MFSRIVFRKTGCALGVVCGLAFLAGCGQQNVEVYRVAKDKDTPSSTTPPPAAGQTMPPMAAAEGASGASVHWTLPAGWQELPPNQMRVGNFLVKGPGDQKAEVTIIPLSGMAGGELDNVNRWRGQVGQGPLTQEQMMAAAEKVEIAGTPSRMYDQAGTQPGQGEKARILAALLQRGDTTWFFKMTGSDALVEQSKPAFVQFLKSANFSEGAPASAAMAKLDTIASTPPPDADAGQNSQNWTVPGGWQQQAPGPMQLAKYSVGDKSGAQAEVTVASFPGDVGGMAANLDRWRRQLGLPPVSQEELTKSTTPLDLPAGKATLVDMNNPQDKKAMRAAIVPRDGQTWFFKLMGDPAAVDAQKDAFVHFLQSWK